MANVSAYKVDYNDEQLKAIDKEGAAAVKDSNAMYDDMINQSDSYFDAQIDAVKQYGETQKKNQQEQTDFAITEIEQQKEYAHQDYIKEQSGAYVDWQKQSDQYGVNAEQRAAQGMAGTGYSESSQVAMYNTYQNRVATARESYQRSVDSYNNAITEARLQNNSLLAEIAFNTLQTSLELGLQGFQYKNTLLENKAATAREIDRDYYSRYQDRINQINTENALAEQIRQFNESQQLEIDKLNESIRQYNQEYDLKVKQHNESIRQFNEEIARLKAQDKKENEYKIKQLEIQKQQTELQKQQLAEEKRQHNNSIALQKQQLAENKRQYNNSLTLQKQQLAEDKRQYNLSYNLQKKNLNSSSGSSSGSSGGSGGGTNPKKDDRTTATRDDGNTTPKTTREQALNKVNKGQIKTYAQAQALLKKYNIKPKVPMLDSATWQKAKKMGTLSSEFEGISTYAQYVQRYCRYALGA